MSVICESSASARLRQLMALAIAAAVLLCGLFQPAAAHEFWLEPSDFRPRTGQELSITLRNGQFFKGNSLPFIKAWFARFVVTEPGPGKARPVISIEGDDPAVRLTFKTAGLAIGAYVSTPDKLKFATREKFETYLKSEGLDQSLGRFAAWRPGAGSVEESYVRCAKTLITVAGSGGGDRRLGLPLELVAERDLSKLPASQPLPVRVYFNGRPMPGLMIKVFSQSDRKTPQRLRTDKDGRAMIALPKSGTYLLSAVHMLAPPAPPQTEWKSYWASMTLFRP